MNGQPVLRGTPGSVRLDVVEGGVLCPTCVYDLKTGSAVLTPNRIQQIQSSPSRWCRHPCRGDQTVRNKEFATIIDALKSNIEIPSIKAPLWFFLPVEYALRGVCFEGSSFDSRSFYVWAFVQPTCVPAEHLSFSLGKRILNGSADRWNSTDPAMLSALQEALRTQALPFLNRADSIGGAIELAEDWSLGAQPYLRQAAAYWLVLAGHDAKAKVALEELQGTLSPGVHWQEAMAAHANELLRLLQVDAAQARQRLGRMEK